MPVLKYWDIATGQYLPIAQGPPGPAGPPGPVGATGPAGPAVTIPPAVGSGSGLVTYTDANGGLWVAKGGVNGGAYRPARDVLHARWTRVGAWNAPTNWSAMPYDTPAYDDYGIYLPAFAGWFTPVAGVYLIQAAVTANLATVSTLLIAINQGTSPPINNVYSTSAQNSMNWGITAQITVAMWCSPANQEYQIMVTAATQMTGQTGWLNNWFSIDYLGSR